MADTLDTTAEDLARCSLDELERVFAAPAPVEIPTGRFRGRFLRPVASATARAPLVRLYTRLGFDLFPFGVDFAARRWFFWHPQLRVGAFTPQVGPSRWRDTRAVSLHYQVSRLPAPVRNLLYDEVKPLGPSLCLGLGGVNADRGRGDHFFFALERVAS